MDVAQGFESSHATFVIGHFIEEIVAFFINLVLL